MLTTRWQPLVDFQADMNRVRDEMDRAFGRCTGRRLPMAAAPFPLLNVWEDDDRTYVEAELPGMELDDLEILVHGDQLSIKGERKAPAKEDGTWHRRERSSGRFSRELQLPEDVDSEGVVAEFKHGVLTVTLPKREEVKPRRIEVQAR